MTGQVKGIPISVLEEMREEKFSIMSCSHWFCEEIILQPPHPLTPCLFICLSVDCVTHFNRGFMRAGNLPYFFRVPAPRMFP